LIALFPLVVVLEEGVDFDSIGMGFVRWGAGDEGYYVG